ncbi:MULTISPECIES: RDD family protein [Caldimonas]|uniref:RDD family protein n=1 Tax=Caldimonas TaxID=196013 RepID=UPI001FDF03D5|nr:RDD family protein [Caldimonas manganoxidans]
MSTHPSSISSPGVSPSPSAPTLRRRLACLVYETVLLFGIVMITGLVYGVATGQRHALVGRLGLGLLVAAVLALYFVWCWTQSGQTLPMQTWRIRLEGPDGRPPGLIRALSRFFCAWIWVLPGLGLAHLMGWTRSGWTVFAALAGWALAYALSSLLRADRQFWHDALCGTRLVLVPPIHRTGS